MLTAAADQVLPLRAIAGNDGLVQRVEFAPYTTRIDAGWQTIRGDAVQVQIETGALDTAWVCGVAGAAVPRRELRLYDAEGRAIAIIGAVPAPDGRDPDIWRTRMNALLS